MLHPSGVYLLDTSILVHFVRDNAPSRRLEAIYSFRSVGVTPLISVVTEGEIESLALQLGWGAQRQQRLHLAFTLGAPHGGR